MLQRLPTETVYEESVVHRRCGKFYASCYSKKKTDAKLEKGLRGFCAIALLSVFSKLYTTVLVDMLHDEKVRSEWKRSCWSREGSEL